MRVLIAMDKFKGSVTALEAGRSVARGLARICPHWQVDVCAIADGGEGTAEVLVQAKAGHWRTADVLDARARPRQARYGWLPGNEAVMEMSEASGLALVADLPLDPASASTFGTGQLMRQAILDGAKRLFIGIGGSATNDGGIGMAQALGFRFHASDGAEVADLPRQWEAVGRIERSPISFPEIVVACDVDNPLLGERGATAIYGPQKGVTNGGLFEARLAKLAALVQRDLGADFSAEPGAGAAGGLGFGLMAFCGARLTSGFDLVAMATGLRDRMAGADIVITGEGSLDAQSLSGKGPVGAATLARAAGAKVIGLAGGVSRSAGLAERFDLLLACKPESMPLAEAMQRGAELIEESVVQHADAIMGLGL